LAHIAAFHISRISDLKSVIYDDKTIKADALIVFARKSEVKKGQKLRFSAFFAP
jgi:hypothetical protein